MSENPLILLALDAAWSCSNADAPAFKHVDLQGSLVDLGAAKIQIAAVAMVNLAHAAASLPSSATSSWSAGPSPIHNAHLAMSLKV